MTTLLVPASRCFARSGAPGLLRPFFTNPETSATLRSKFGILQCSATRSISGRGGTRNPAAALVSPCRISPSSSPRPRHGPQRQQTRGAILDSLAKDSWRSRLWQDGYDSNFIVTQYDRIPASYTDEEGLRFAAADLTQPEIRTIFGAQMDVDEGNRLLRVLHGRRVAGTLDHPEFFPTTGAYSQDSIARGLHWLRRTVPVEETLNAALRAEEELEQLEKWKAKPKLVLRSRGKGPGRKDKKTKQAQQEEKSKDEALEKEEEFKPDPIYGYSPVDELRFHNQKEARKREKKRQEERRARLEAEGLAPQEVGTLMAQDPNRIHFPTIRGRVMTEKMKEYHRLGMVSELEAAPEMPLWQRVGPSTLFGLVFTGIIFMWMMAYQPPREHERIMPSIPFAVATMIPIVATTLVVYVAWKRPQWWNFMNRYFLLVPALPRAASVLLSAFSHQQFSHLAANLVPLILVGIPLCDMVGRGEFVYLVFNSAVGANLGSLWFNAVIKEFRVSGQGISAVVAAVVCMYFYLCRNEKYRFGIPKEIFSLPGEVDPGIPGLAILTLFILYNLFAMLQWRKNKIDHITHVAGILMGLGHGYQFERMQELRRQRKEQNKNILTGGNQGSQGSSGASGTDRKTEGEASSAA